MTEWVLVVLLVTASGPQQRPPASTAQKSNGACSPNINQVAGNVTVTIRCGGVNPSDIAEIGKIGKEIPAALERLNELLTLRDQELAQTRQELGQSIAEIADWSRKYRELTQRVEQDAPGDELSRRAAALLKAGDVENAGRLLDDILARDEADVDRAAAHHYNRGRAFELEFKPQEALSHYEKSYTYRPHLWRYAFAYARLLHQQHDYEKAESAYNAALDELNKNRSAHLPDVATTLTNLGALYRETNRIPEATEAFEDALGIGRWLVKASNGAEFQPYLASTLDNLGTLYLETKQTKDAARVYREALDLRRRLARGANRMAYLPDVATTLDHLGSYHLEIGQLSSARVRYDEALSIRRELAKANPSAYLPHVAQTLGNLGKVYVASKQPAAAERAFQEALGIWREVAQTNRAAHLPQVADTLHDLGALYRTTKRLTEAEDAYKESLAIRRELAIDNGAAFLPRVAATLHDLGLVYRSRDGKADAERAFDEAVTLRRTFWSANAPAYGDDLAKSLMELARTRGAKNTAACEMLREAFKVARSFEVRGQSNAGVKALCAP